VELGERLARTRSRREWRPSARRRPPVGDARNLIVALAYGDKRPAAVDALLWLCFLKGHFGPVDVVSWISDGIHECLKRCYNARHLFERSKEYSNLK
jgi:hypothetical protein